MLNIYRRNTLYALCFAALLPSCSASSSTSTPASADHIRGTVTRLEGPVLTVQTPDGLVNVQLAQATQIATVDKAGRDHIRPGSFVGIASVTDPGGSQRAVEVHVFAESMRGTGEGSHDWDLPSAKASSSRMTNGTVSSSRMTNGTVSASKMTNGTVTEPGAGSSLIVNYKGGAQTIAVPADIPFVALEPGQAQDLQPGAHVFIVAHQAGAVLTADRVLVGRNGVVPPM
jgi:hypothetical protein